MKTIELKLYKFQELNNEARQKAIEDKVKQNSEYIYMDCFNDDAIEQIKDAGFENPKLEYSLSYSQGDGLSFKADGITQELKDSIFKAIGLSYKRAEIIEQYLIVKITGNKGHYSYAKKDQIDVYLESNYSGNEKHNIQKYVDLFLNELEEIYMDLCNKLEKQGYNEYEYQCSEEYAIQEIEDNDDDFLENGEKY